MRGVKFGLFVDPDTTRYSGLRLRRLKEAIKDSQVVDALVEELEVTGATGGNKMAAIERRIEELRATKSSLWFEVAAPEVLAASIFRAKKLQGPVVDDLFKRVARVQQLAAPLATWLDMAGLTPHPGSAPGLGRANLIGYRGGGMLVRRAGGRGSRRPTTSNELGRALDEPKSGARQVDRVVPRLHARAGGRAPLGAHRRQPRAGRRTLLRAKVQAGGFGLLLVEGDAVAQTVLPLERKLDAGKLAAIATALQSSKPGG